MSSCRSVLLFSVMCTAVSFGQTSTQLIRRFVDCGASTHRFAAYDDLDGDGIGDFVKNCAGGVVTVDSGATGASLLSVTVGGGLTAWIVGTVDDIDADGRRDLVIQTIGNAANTLSVWSLTQPAAPRWFRGSPAGTSFGFTFYGIAGDVDGDGYEDLLAGYPGGGPDCGNIYAIPPIAAVAGRIEVLSGLTGTTLRTHLGVVGAKWPAAAAGTGDVDYDGKADYVVVGSGRRPPIATSCPGPIITPPVPAAGSRVDAFVGATGASRFAIVGGPAESAEIFEIADADQDGDLDIVVRMQMFLGTNVPPQPFEGVIDATTGGLIAAATTFGTVWPLGRPVGDVDLDGIVDRIQSDGLGNGGSQIRSGATQAVLYTMNGIYTSPVFLSDLDLDGTAEVAFGMTSPGLQPGDSGWYALRLGSTAPQASVTSVGVNCGPPGQTPYFNFSQPPILGYVFPAVYVNGSNGATAVVMAGVPGPPIALPNGCTAHLDPGFPLIPIWTATLDSGGSASTLFHVPAIPGIAGATLRLQGFHFAPGYGFAATDAKDLVIGF